ncbi:peptidoglycan DD-metalloendopeptidase family protein [Nocardia sp. NPDC052278]|uniref:peptidoglycan DD-metalloendopeptidase family protein n=1 Tax=unclassified Nocardia TaxID=2637762 RepID=UPI00368AB5C7
MKSGTYHLSDGFGPRGGEFHQGQDFGSTAGVPIYAAVDGVVAAAGPASGFGVWIVIDSNVEGKVLSTVYGHMFAADVEVGQSVRAGQAITTVGYNGEVFPPGPSGAHLHFEVWPGGRLTGQGSPVDPMLWLAGAAEPGTSTAPTPPSTTAPDVGLAASSAELPPLAGKGSEEHMQIDTIRVARSVAARFPEITTFYGWRETDSHPDHPSGRAVDIMIPDYTSGDGKALGDRIADYVLANQDAFHIDYVIWRRIYRPANGDSSEMDDLGNDTANHLDHVHVTTMGGGYPDGAASVGSAPPTGSGASSAGCGPRVDDDLAPGSVPPQYQQWYRRAGALCPQISASLLAAQGKQESGFDPRAGSSAGAQGIAQFLPGTAASIDPDDGQPYVIDANGNGVASVWEPEDAIIGQGRYMCAIARKVDTWIAEGKVQAPNGRAELYLAAYNAGEGAVLSSGGFPTGSSDYQTQTRPYCDTILATARRFAKTLS